jgi:hypothetical protein
MAEPQPNAEPKIPAAEDTLQVYSFKTCKLYIYIYHYLFGERVMFKLRALYLLGRYSTT